METNNHLTLNGDITGLPDYLGDLVPPRPVQAEHITSELLTDLAYGIDDVEQICANHGLDQAETKWLLNDDNAAREVESIRKRLTATGAMSEVRAEVYLDQVLTEMFHLAMLSTTEPQHRVAAAKFIRDVRNDRKPAQEKVNEKFTININLGGTYAPVTVDASCERVPNAH